jgi:hypothetical protein
MAKDKYLDSDIKKDYSEINDIEELIKKLADDCANIARKNVVADFFKKNTDDLMEVEIKKFNKRLSEIGSKDLNILQVFFQKWIK